MKVQSKQLAVARPSTSRQAGVRSPLQAVAGAESGLAIILPNATPPTSHPVLTPSGLWLWACELVTRVKCREGGDRVMVVAQRWQLSFADVRKPRRALTEGAPELREKVQKAQTINQLLTLCIQQEQHPENLCPRGSVFFFPTLHTIISKSSSRGTQLS